MKNFLLLYLLATSFLTSCEGAPTEPDLPYVTSQEVIDKGVSNGDLTARAVVASGLYDDIAPGDYPFMLIRFNEGGLEAYIAEQGLSEEAFLAHPKLYNFMQRHLIPSFVDNIKIRSTPNGRFTYTSAADSEVVFTTGENLSQTPENLNTAKANGVPFNPYCLVSGNGAEGDADFMAEQGLICWADGPTVKSFDWSE